MVLGDFSLFWRVFFIAHSEMTIGRLFLFPLIIDSDVRVGVPTRTSGLSIVCVLLSGVYLLLYYPLCKRYKYGSKIAGY